MSLSTTLGASRRFQCRHIFTDGHRCGSPCLRGEQFCFYHHSTRGRRVGRDGVQTVDLSQGEHRASPFTVPNPEDRSAIQVAIGEILNRLASNELDPRRAGLLLYGLQIASANLPAASALPAAPVEETATDPDLGTLALPAEILPDDPAVGRPSSLFAHLLRELNRSHPAPPEAVRYPERDATTHRSHHP